MSLFLQDVVLHPFLARALLGSVLAAVAAGIIGALVVARRSTYLAGAVSHSILAGFGVARLLQRRFEILWLSPMAGAILVALGVALLLARLSVGGRQRVDSALSAVWTGGMALGISCVAATPGYQDDLMSYLFGSILLVSNTDLLWMGALNLVIIVVVALCHNRFLAVAFDEELARLRGINTTLYETIYYVLTALTIVLLTRVAGIVLAVALLTLPAATAGIFARSILRMMIGAVSLGILSATLGMAVSYAPEWPPGATIVEFALLAYIAGLCWKRARSS